ncbi:PAS domain-containing sensor histidine kinase [Pyxidicoccus fallax]|uniref:histidine kinase n=2 Tax=Pyxidicoccus fallax TaxID=394095 RepID=A0A848LZ09_9BACT|nr:PAS domain-containing protein [Pyxidicoccus fallax]NMO22861.1 PAS domain-containing protein [Pyxidicoccus fallax]NPC85151.1 PAS domain-containing sensor histidine kinase [Pyxidicoccus fallax]
MVGLSSLPGAALAWAPHAGSPAPCLRFEPTRGPGGEVLDFQWTGLNPAAEDVVRDWGLDARLSRWPDDGVRGLEVEDCVRLGRTGVPVSVPLRVRRGGMDARFHAVAVKEGDGFALWLLPPVDGDAPELREALTREQEARQRAETALEDARALRAREELLRLALSTARMVAWEWTEARRAVTWSQEADAFFGQPPGTLGTSLPGFLSCVVVEDRARVARGIEQALAADGPYTLKFRCRHADGTTRWYEAVGQGLRDGERAHRLVGVVMDVTEREQAEAALREAEERYRLASRATHDVLWDWDLSTGSVRWDAGSGDLFGYGPERSSHGLGWWEERVHPDEREAAAASLRDFVASTGAAWQAEYRFLRQDGTWAHVLDRGVLARDAAGRPVRMIGSMMDITERTRALERLSEEARFRERFIGILGHDLRNPLNAITLCARAIRRRGPHGSPQQQQSQRIEASAARMGAMISDILDLTRARLSGGIPLNLAPANLATVCRQVVEELGAAWPGRHIAFEVDGRAEGVWDADRLEQVLSNLVGNALEHGAQDAPVLLRCAERDGAQVLEVHNPGVPIPGPQLATLFDPFRQAGAAREKGPRRGGLGLGLFIVREIVQAHGGTVSVSSSERDGTTFTVTLPRDTRQARLSRGA